MKHNFIIINLTVAAFGLCILFGSVLFQYTRPMEDAVYNLSLSWEGEAMPEDWIYDQKGWRMFTSDGELTADGIGGFYGAIEPGDTFYFSRKLTEKLDDPTLRLSAGGNSIAVFLDDILLYTDQPELTGGIGELTLTPLEWWRDTPVTVSLPTGYEGRTLTIAQSSGLPEVEREYFTVWPCEVSLYCGYAYESSLIAESFSAAVPGALLLATGTLLLFVFVLNLSRRQTDTSLLWAAVTVFLWMTSLLEKLSFTMEYRGESIIDWGGFCRLAAIMTLLAFLSSRGGKYRHLLWIVTILDAAACGIYLFLEWKYEFIESNLISFLCLSLPQLVSMAGLFTVLVCSWVLWRKENRFYALFTPFVSIGSIAILAMMLLTRGRQVWQQLVLAVEEAMPGYFLWPLANVFTLVTILTLSIILTEQELHRRTEARLLKEHSELAMQSYESMKAQNEKIQMMRHDMVKHFSVLRQMNNEKQRTDYLNELIGRNEKIHPVVQSGNQMLDIIINSKLSQVVNAGATVEILRCIAPEKLPFTDAELCSIVMNLMDNAVAAVTAPDIHNPYLRLDLHIKGKFFVFALENSMGKNTQKRNRAQHGLGLKIVRQFLEKYEDLMEVEQEEGRYKVTLAIPLSMS